MARILLVLLLPGLVTAADPPPLGRSATPDPPPLEKRVTDLEKRVDALERTVHPSKAEMYDPPEPKPTPTSPVVVLPGKWLQGPDGLWRYYPDVPAQPPVMNYFPQTTTYAAPAVQQSRPFRNAGSDYGVAGSPHTHYCEGCGTTYGHGPGDNLHKNHVCPACGRPDDGIQGSGPSGAFDSGRVLQPQPVRGFFRRLLR